MKLFIVVILSLFVYCMGRWSTDNLSFSSKAAAPSKLHLDLKEGSEHLLKILGFEVDATTE